MNQKTKEFKNLLEYYKFTKKDEGEYPVISGILESLTPERIKREIEEIKRVKLPPELQKWVEEYEKAGERNRFFWKFIYKLNEIINPFSFTKKSVINVKILLVMLIVLIDDVAEKPQDTELLKDLLKIPLDNRNLRKTNLTIREKDYLSFSIRLWQFIQKKIQKYDNYKKFQEIFYYDVKQVLNAIEYSHLVNRNLFLINRTEYWTYAPYTMQGMINYMLDIMYASNVDIKEMGLTREIFLRAQKLARIANCLATWQREIAESDLDNGVLIYAMESKIISVQDLKKPEELIIKKIRNSNIEKIFLQEWEGYYEELRVLCAKTEIINSRKFLSQLKKLFFMYLVIGNLGR